MAEPIHAATAEVSLRHCVTCGATAEPTHRYCSACGERLDRPPLTLARVLQQAWGGVTSMDRGFLFNLKHLTLSPQHLVERYLRGERKRIYNPIAYALIATTLYLVADTIFYDPPPFVRPEDPSALNQWGYETGKFLRTNFKYVWLSGVIWLGLAGRACFPRYRLAEHFAIAGFILGHVTFLAVLGIALFNWLIVFNPLVYLAVAVMVYATFTRPKERIWTSVRALLAMGFFGLLPFMLSFLLALLF